MLNVSLARPEPSPVRRSLAHTLARTGQPPAFGRTNELVHLPAVMESEDGKHLLHEVPLTPEGHADGLETGIVNFVPENVFGTAKYETCKTRGVIVHDVKKDKPRYLFVGFPGIYGFLPQTEFAKAKGGDEDGLDVLVLGQNNASMGKPFPIRILGALDMRRDREGGVEERKLVLLAVPLNDGQNLRKIKTIDELGKKQPGVLEILKVWFTHYKGLNAQRCEGVLSLEDTMAIVKDAHNDWKPIGETYQQEKATKPQLSITA